MSLKIHLGIVLRMIESASKRSPSTTGNRPICVDTLEKSSPTPGATPGPPQKEPKTQYLTNADLLLHWTQSKAQGSMTKELAQDFVLLADKVSKHHWFVGYSYREDLRSAAVVRLVEYWDRFKPEFYTAKGLTPKPHAYFSQVCFHALSQALKKEYKHHQDRASYDSPILFED